MERWGKASDGSIEYAENKTTGSLFQPFDRLLHSAVLRAAALNYAGLSVWKPRSGLYEDL